ncbi:hypothetical protein C8R46DRAFT_1124078 [Mycena filopes]|nr:hypothetical protein C8R46DRAFT_1124078 [Mycena filopes]
MNWPRDGSRSSSTSTPAGWPSFVRFVEDPAAARIWAVYVDEAEKYDRALVESWKADMEGMLIFAGLFSASLTAFLVESYKTLNPDPSSDTVRLLNQISQQLAASANGSKISIPGAPDFAPGAAALTCNALWFTSLGFSLSCALIATLLEQWARDFIHRSEMKSAPLLRARIFSFLYYGLKRFNMHAVVEVIPLLLHTALLLFFAGLVAFLIPINLAMALIAALILGIVTSVYFYFTLLPLRYLDSPYHTPLSGTFWRLFRALKRNHTHMPEGRTEAPLPPPDNETIVQAMVRAATESSAERQVRDEHALVWTVKSLSDDRELEPFVEAIPDTLWGPNGRRPGYTQLLRNVLSNPEIALYDRIYGLFTSCETGLLTPTEAKRRRIICHKAVWAIATLLDSAESTRVFLRSIGAWATRSPQAWDDPELLPFTRSLEVLIKLRSFQMDKLRLEENLQYLMDCQAGMQPTDLVNLKPLLNFLTDLDDEGRDYFVDLPSHRLRDLRWNESYSVDVIPPLIEDFQHVLATTPYLILFSYIQYAAQLEGLPYFFRQTIEIIRPPPGKPAVRLTLDETLDIVVSRMMKFNPEGDHWLDTLMQDLLPYWPHAESQDNSVTPTLSLALIRYLNHRRCDSAVQAAMYSIPRADAQQFWNELAASLRHARKPVEERDILSAIWRLETLKIPSVTSDLTALLDEVARWNGSSLGLSVLALLRCRYLKSLTVWLPADTDPMQRFRNLLPPSPTAAVMPSDSDTIRDTPRGILEIRLFEAYVVLFADFLTSCAGPESEAHPYNAATTLECIAFKRFKIHTVHETHQIRLATAIRQAFADPQCAALRTVVVNSLMFDADRPRWLNNEEARTTIAAALAQYADELAASDDPTAVHDLARVRTILAAPLNERDSVMVSDVSVFGQ